MRLELTNINKIKSAAIDLKGLTVIAGTNDSGKSTLGKMLFTVVKSLGETHVNKEEEKADRILEKIEEFYYIVTRRFAMPGGLEERERFKQEFLPPRMMTEISSFYGNSLLSGEEREQMLLLYIEEKKQRIKHYGFGPITTKSCFQMLNAIYEEISEETEDKSTFTREFRSGIRSEFLGHICSDGTRSSAVTFYGEEGGAKIVISDDEIKQVEISPDLYYPLADVTFVETPLYMQLMNTFSNAITYKELASNRNTITNSKPVVPLHIKDLANKLELSQYNFGKRTANAMGIEQIIDGYFEYDKRTKDFQIVRKQHGKMVKVKSINVASGIKMFGLIQLLLEVGEISEKKMLIIDEPENHLHPKWQVECAHLLVKMAKAGIPLMVSSHSPYFIQGIRYFANKEQAEGLVNYYLAEEDEATGYSIVTEATDDLNKIFVKLAEPLNEIMNLD